ncbi:MAG: hypothetical protein QXE05_07585 [Nitrososphaeria archaeon]
MNTILCIHRIKNGKEITAEKQGEHIILRYGEKTLEFDSIIKIDPVKIAAIFSGIDFEKQGFLISASEWEVKPSDIIELKHKIQPKNLIFQGNGRIVQVLAEDGYRVNAAQLFFKHHNEVVVGEIFWAYCLIKEEEEDGEENEGRKAFLPFIVYAKHRDNVLVKVDIQPLMFLETIDVGGRIISLDLSTKVLSPLNTMISVDTARYLTDSDNSIGISWKEVYETVKSEIKRFVCLDFDSRLYDVIACWIIATYFIEAFSAFPFLYFYGSSGTGKSRALLTSVYLARKGFIVTNPTDATLFRSSEALKPCMGVDESIIGRHIWKLIRTAFKKGILVPRLEKRGKKEEFVLMLFETYMPVAFAADEKPTELGGKDADESRIIFVFMRKEKDPIGRDPVPDDFKQTRDQLYILRLTKICDALKAKEEFEKMDLGLYGHERECWIPLFVIGKLVGEDVLNNLLNYALELKGIQSSTLHYEEKLIIRAIEIRREAYKGKEDIDKFKPSELLEYIKTALNERGEYDEKRFEKQWSSSRVGKILSRMRVFRPPREKNGQPYIVTEDKLIELKKHYGAGNVQEELTPKNEPTPKIDANETKNGVSSVSGVSNFESKNISVEPTLNNIVQKLPTLPTPPTPDQHETNIKNSVDSINGVSNSCTSPTPEISDIQKKSSKNEDQKLFRCKTCGAGPWKDPRTAKGHRDLCKDHEIIEVDAREAFE